MGQRLLLTNDVDDEDPRPRRRTPLLTSLLPPMAGSGEHQWGRGWRKEGGSQEEGRRKEGVGRGKEGGGVAARVWGGGEWRPPLAGPPYGPCGQPNGGPPGGGPRPGLPENAENPLYFPDSSIF